MVIFHSYVSLPEGIPANGYSIVIKNMVRFRQLTMLTVDHEIWGWPIFKPKFLWRNACHFSFRIESAHWFLKVGNVRSVQEPVRQEGLNVNLPMW